MLEHNTIHMKTWNSNTGCNEDTGETSSVYSLAKSLTSGNFSALLQDYLNLGGKGYREGREIGLQLRITHRTLQRLVICFTFGLIAGLSEQEYTDPRNETAIQTARKVAQMLTNDELPVGPYI